ncbi:hypothetical protein QNF07_004384 [Vibrio alginolyticus]|uniref:hypothetical protein n=1 Tax=Vibrio alginolyticus TaxID=663 RepID=UPI001EED757F|nr:hypothetical protein [Vibrio alginolyticus]ELB2756044.1 hypothetical protein [Vibrio alginolyticus]ULF83398.1 hypothetical protein K6750_04715 [Vibrio alginolyticus]
MAIMSSKEVNGVQLPYQRISYIEGSKEGVQVVISSSVSSEYDSLYTKSILMNSEQSIKLGMLLTEQTYLFLKEVGLMSGEDC